LKNENRFIGRMDSTITGIDPDLTVVYTKYDPSLDPLFEPFFSAMNAYVRKDLKLESDRVIIVIKRSICDNMSK
jgi:hypothetical protein